MTSSKRYYPNELHKWRWRDHNSQTTPFHLRDEDVLVSSWLSRTGWDMGYGKGDVQGTLVKMQYHLPEAIYICPSWTANILKSITSPSRAFASLFHHPDHPRLDLPLSAPALPPVLLLSKLTRHQFEDNRYYISDKL
ncbi:hypothetical protein QCA50_014641 [Cerrena zonata]|uniref:Uncharacterized protein n=1 Tax=Cerrena zonata TaxID=2478898 RepID=A0AAW0FNL6_9APHY